MKHAVRGQSWVRYWRSPDQPVEAMHASFHREVYHRHSHETYSFGVTEVGAQTFHCRGASHVSAQGMVMIFNPDEPHDGRAAAEIGFNYRIIHLGPELVRDVLSDAQGRSYGLPLFTSPVIDDPMLAAALRGLHATLTGGATAARRDERLTEVLTLVARRQASRPPGDPGREPVLPEAFRSVRDLIHADPAAELTTDELAAAAGASRFTVYRAFQAAVGMSPSDYQRQLRLRRARALLAEGRPAGDVAAEVGFADQAHLIRWFSRHYGVTPGAYQRAGRTPA
ncbi:AraC family transcriptional regulator [Pseudonocardia spinosispora]|uniref:AraC family transcriptional regulator n=1 Tax=Pseudonocardia spinosispora TaxID=103441 RepID=UPI0003FEF249|nr:AraC family transcriptional regulator [Pseudonocardia spinosispora]